MIKHSISSSRMTSTSSACVILSWYLNAPPPVAMMHRSCDLESLCCFWSSLSLRINSIHASMRSVSNLKKFSRPPAASSPGSREKYTSLAREPPIYQVALACRCLYFLPGGRRGKNATVHGRVPGATTSKESRRSTHINSYMAHNRRVVGKSNVVGIVLVVFAFRRIRLLLVDYESALNIDAHATRMLDGVLNVALGSSSPGTSEVRG